MHENARLVQRHLICDYSFVVTHYEKKFDYKSSYNSSDCIRRLLVMPVLAKDELTSPYSFKSSRLKKWIISRNSLASLNYPFSNFEIFFIFSESHWAHQQR